MYTVLFYLTFAVAVSTVHPQFPSQETAPYAPSGWRPSGRQFTLPQPHTLYGPPPSYGPPSQEYGVPPQEGTTSEEGLVTTTELPTTTENVDLEGDELESDDRDTGAESFDNGEEGVYYIYHPNGVLQRVVYATKDDMKNMAFTAKLKYENVQPIKEPIFTYDPQTLVLKRL